MVTLRERFGRPWRIAATVGLLVVVVFGTLSQGGLLAPRFRLSGGGVSGGLIFNNLQNLSWHSWTITGIRLADQKSARSLPDVKIIGLSLHEYPNGPDNNFGPSVPRLTVAPGQSFSVNLLEKETDCRPLPRITTEAESVRFSNSPANHDHTVPAVVTVATPLGTRDIGTTFSFSCSV